jgi:hypothetical protein
MLGESAMIVDAYVLAADTGAGWDTLDATDGTMPPRSAREKPIALHRRRAPPAWTVPLA